MGIIAQGSYSMKKLRNWLNGRSINGEAGSKRHGSLKATL